MAVKIFAAILIGSSETEMKIFEFTSRKGMKEVDCMSTRLDLGVDAYRNGKISVDKLEELCLILREFKRNMNAYRVDAYRLCATSAFRETKNMLIMKDYIERRTGLSIEVLSNSEQRFLDYKSIASETEEFQNIIKNGTIIVDVGGSSLQVSLFDKDKLMTTQNIHLGNVKTREKLYGLERDSRHFERMLTELVNHEIAGFKKLHLKDRAIKNLIVVGGNLIEMLKGHMLPGKKIISVTKEQYREIYEKVVYLNPQDIADQFGLPYEYTSLVVPSAIICKCLGEQLEADTLWLPLMSLNDGMAYDYGEKNKLIPRAHDFEEDIIIAARNISKRYKCSQSHIRNLEELGLGIFDKVGKANGLTTRDRLLLQIAVILHSCGKYISLAGVAECAYNIIMATEIIGLSHEEREIIANVVKFNTLEFTYFGVMASSGGISREEYLRIAKLTAILRIANAMDRSHRQKCKGAAINLKDQKLTILVDTQEDLTLEKGEFAEKSEFFEEVFHIRPVLKQKKRI